MKKHILSAGLKIYEANKLIIYITSAWTSSWFHNHESGTLLYIHQANLCSCVLVRCRFEYLGTICIFHEIGCSGIPDFVGKMKIVTLI